MAAASRSASEVAASRVLVLAHARKTDQFRPFGPLHEKLASQSRCDEIPIFFRDGRFGFFTPARGNNCCPLRSARRKIEAARDQVLTSSRVVISADAGDFNIRDMLTVAWAFRWKAGP
jgi:hypothetical protein